jgi:ABC-type phosphate transport system substrate-binding protein
MQRLSKLLVGVATMASTAALVAGTVTTASAAPNDPPAKTAPASYDIVGVGSSTTQYVMDAISTEYNAGVKVHSPAHPKLYSFDAWKPNADPNGVTKIAPKAGCKSIVRPNGSGAGLTALNTTGKVKIGTASYPCLNYSRSSGARKPTDPKKGAGGVVFVAFAKDAITWAARSAAKGGTDAPASLTLKQLQGIFTCKTTNWSQVGGKNAKIKVYLPQSGSGTLSTWEKFMGITGNLGSCVTSTLIEENEGTNKAFNSPNAVFIYSIGAYVAQKYHSALPGKKPGKGQNAFGTNLTGFLQPMKISGIAPTTTAKVPTINPKFPASFSRTLYNVVNFNANTKDDLGKILDGMFGAKSVKGFLCTSAKAQATIKAYGFVPTPLCGSTS